MDNTVMIVYKIAVYVMQLLHIKITDNISCRPLFWLTNDVINGADKHALSSLLLRLSHLGRNFKSCLLSTPDVKKPFIWRQENAVSVPVGFGKKSGFGFKNRNSPSAGHSKSQAYSLTHCCIWPAVTAAWETIISFHT